MMHMMQLSYLKKLQEDLQVSEEERHKKEANNEVLNRKAYFNKQFIHAFIFSRIRPIPFKRNVKNLKDPKKRLKRKKHTNYLRKLEEGYQLEDKNIENNPKKLHFEKLAMTFQYRIKPCNSTLPNDGFFPPNRAPRKPRTR